MNTVSQRSYEIASGVYNQGSNIAKNVTNSVVDYSSRILNRGSQRSAQSYMNIMGKRPPVMCETRRYAHSGAGGQPKYESIRTF